MGYAPVCHYSSSRKDFEEPAAKKEAHADFLYEQILSYGKPVDIVLEAKMKELALLRYLGKDSVGTRSDLTEYAVKEDKAQKATKKPNAKRPKVLQSIATLFSPANCAALPCTKLNQLPVRPSFR